VEQPRVRILVVVANTQVRSLRTEAWRKVPREQQLGVGKSALSDKGNLYSKRIFK